jgi:hypothetical protein
MESVHFEYPDTGLAEVSVDFTGATGVHGAIQHFGSLNCNEVQ